jgi:hypothetical protein
VSGVTGTVRLLIIDGVISVGDETFDNTMPTDVLADGHVKLVFSGAEGVLDVVGVGVRVEVTGEAVFVEGFPGRG